MPTTFVLTLPANDTALRDEMTQQLAPVANIHEIPPSLGLNEIKLVLEIVGAGVTIAGGVGSIFEFLWKVKDRAAKEGRRTNIKVGRLGEGEVSLDDADESLLRRLLDVKS